MTRGKIIAVDVTGVLIQGAPMLNLVGERVEVPADKIERHELLYRIGRPAPSEVGLRVGDLVVVEQRRDGRSATGELVLSTLDDKVFVGRWWEKHERRALLDESLEPIIEDNHLIVLGVVNVVMR